jgi:D-alanine transaminase
MAEGLLYLDGAYMPISEGRVSVEDRGFQFADGVYEVIRVYNGRPFRIGRHLARLERSLAGLEIPAPETMSRIEEVCGRVLNGLREATIYLQVTRGTAPRKHTFPPGARPTFVAYARELVPASPDKTFSLLSVRDDRWGRCHLKVIALLPNILGREKAARAGCDEGLFVREDGTVTEGTASNAFLVRGGAVQTHPADARILAGVTREAVIEVARGLGIAVSERPFSLMEALAAEEFFMSGTTGEITPATSIDGRRVGDGAAGPVTLRLQAALRDLVRRECP